VWCHRRHPRHSRFVLQAKLQQNTTSQLHKRHHLALVDSSRRPQHERTTRSCSGRRQAARWFDSAAVELRTQRHLGRHSSRHWGTPISSRAPSPVPVPLRLQLPERQQNTSLSAGPTISFQWPWKHLAP